jgi:hypothetical protein
MRGFIHSLPLTSYGLMRNSAEKQLCSCTFLVDWLFQIDVCFVVRNANFDSRTSLFSGAFAEWRRAAVNLVMSVCQHVNNLAPTGQIVMRFDIWGWFENLSINSRFIIICECDGYFAWTVYIYDKGLLNPSWNEIFFGQSCVENHNTFFSRNYLRKSCLYEIVCKNVDSYEVVIEKWRHYL